MLEIARSAAPQWIHVDGITNSTGVPLIADADALAASASSVAAMADSDILDGYDAVIIGAFGDPGRDQLAQRIDRKPVIGIGQASMAKAAALSAGRFSVATTTPSLSASIRQLAESYGHGSSLRSVRTPPIGSDASKLMADADATEQELAWLVRQAIEEDGAGAVVIGGGPLAVAARALAPRFPHCPIIEPIPAAVELVAQELGKTREAIRLYP